MLELVGISEAARRLGVHKSTISRQVAAGIITNRGTGQRPLVNVDQARGERAAYLDEGMQGNHAGLLLGDSVTPGQAEEEDTNDEAVAGTNGAGTY